jgi:hypothetical protein
MKTTINLHVEIECEDESVDKGLVADFICASINKKFKKVKGVVVYDSKKIIAGSRKKEEVV